MSSYSYFAEFYDGLTENVEYDKRADYLMQLFKRHEHEPGVTLDLACGTGSLTLALKKRGVDVFGADASADMLTVAAQKAYDEDIQILFLNQRMQDLKLYGMIDTCVCTLDSINHLPSERDVVRTFLGVSRYLADDGLFVFDANTVYKHKHILGEQCYIYDTEKVFCAWQNSYTPRNHRVTITLDFFVPEGGSYRRCTEQFSEYAYTREKMTELLSQGGLSIEAVYDDLSFTKPAGDSQREIYVVRKMKK